MPNSAQHEKNSIVYGLVGAALEHCRMPNGMLHPDIETIIPSLNTLFITRRKYDEKQAGAAGALALLHFDPLIASTAAIGGQYAE